MNRYSRVFAAVDLDAVVYNMEAMQANLAQGTRIIGVVKADGYGHGAVPVAQVISPFVGGYAVATVDEAINLRNHGIQGMILVLGVTHESRFEDLIRYQISPTVFRYEKVKLLSGLASDMESQINVHIAVDTGMSRIGLLPDTASADEVVRMSRLPGIRLEGLFTHFAKADETDKSGAIAQLAGFLSFDQMLNERGIHIPVRHCANSAGIIDIRQADLDMVRAGISIYGLYPSDEVLKSRVTLKPVLSMKTYVTYVKKIIRGTEVSYGGTFRADRDMVVATLPVGYGDGYPRNLSGKGEVLIHGQRAPILGRVCMDQMMIDVSFIKGVREDDEVTLIGRDGMEEIAVEELAVRCGGFHYEILCDIGKRVPRVYLKDGKVVGSKDYFDDAYYDFGYQKRTKEL